MSILANVQTGTYTHTHTMHTYVYMYIYICIYIYIHKRNSSVCCHILKLESFITTLKYWTIGPQQKGINLIVAAYSIRYLTRKMFVIKPKRFLPLKLSFPYSSHYLIRVTKFADGVLTYHVCDRLNVSNRAYMHSSAAQRSYQYYHCNPYKEISLLRIGDTWYLFLSNIL